MFAENRFVFDNKEAPAAAKENMKKKEDVLKEVKTESDKRVAVVKEKLDNIGGRFTGDLYDKLYEYYQTSLERAAKDGVLDEKAYKAYKDEVLKKTDEILKKYTPTEEEQKAAKEGNDSAKDIAKMKEATPAKLEDIPKELPEDTPLDQLNDKIQDYAILTASFQGAVQKRLGEINDFYQDLKAYQESKQGFKNRAKDTWDKVTGLLPGVDCNDEKKVKRLNRDLSDLKDDIESKKKKYGKKKEEIEKYGKSISRVLGKRREKMLQARGEEIKTLEGQQGEKAEAIKANEKRYKELKDQQEKLFKRREELGKQKEELDAVRNADDSPQNVAKKLAVRKSAVERVADTEKDKEEALMEMLKEPNLTDEQKEALNNALKEVQDRRQKMETGKTYIQKSIDKSKGVDVALTEEESAVEGDLGTVGDAIDKVVEPSMIALEEQATILEVQKKAYGECIEGVKDKYDKQIESLDKVQKDADTHILDASLANSLSFAVLTKASENLDKVSITSRGVFGTIWDDVKDLYQDTVGKVFSVPAGWLTDIGKWIAEQGNVATQGAYGINSGWKYPAAVGANIVALFTGATGGMFELAGGILNIPGKPFDVLEGIGALVSINAKTGKIGDGELSAKAWKTLGKTLIAYDDFKEGNIGTGVGKIFTTVASLFIGGEFAEGAEAASTAARVEAVAAAGGKAGFFTGRLAEAGAFFREMGAQIVKKPTWMQTSKEIAEAANIANASKGASVGLKTMAEAKTIGEMGEQSGKVVKAFEEAEQAANSAQKIKADKAAEMAKRAEAAEAAAKATSAPKDLAKAQKLRALADEAATQAKQAEEAAKLAKAAKDAIKTADDAIKAAQEMEKLKGAEAAETIAARDAAKAAIDKAKIASDAAQVSAEAVGGGSKALAVFKNYGEKAIEKLPGGTKAAERVMVAEGKGAKALAIAQGTGEIFAKTAWEGVKLTGKGVKLIFWDLPRYAFRLPKALYSLTKLIAREATIGERFAVAGGAWGEGGAVLAMRFARVNRALKIMEKEAGGLEALRGVWTEKVLGNEELVQNILKGIKEDKALSGVFKDVDIDAMAKLIKEDPSLMKLYEANPLFHKVFESRALMKLMEVDRTAGIQLARIKDAAEVIFQWSAKDERVAKILDGIFDKGLYPKVTKTKKGKAGETVEKEVAVETAEVEAAAEPVITKTMKEEYTKLQLNAKTHPDAENFILKDAERTMREAFEKRFETETAVDAEKIAGAVEAEFGDITFSTNRSVGEVKIGGKSYELKANDAGKLELYEVGKAEVIAPPKVAPAEVVAPAPEVVIAVPDAALEQLLKDMEAGKIPSTYPVAIDDAAMASKYYKRLGDPGVSEKGIETRIDKAMKSGSGEITANVPANSIQNGFLSAMRKKAAESGLEIGEFQITEKVTAKGKVYEVTAPIGKKSVPVAPVGEVSPALEKLPELSPEMEALLKGSPAIRIGRFVRDRLKQAKGLYKSAKGTTEGAKKAKGELKDLLKENGVFITKLLGPGFNQEGTFEEMMAANEFAIIKIETLADFPPDMTLPPEVLEWEGTQPQQGEPTPPERPEAGTNIESSPVDEENMKVSIDNVLKAWRDKDPGEITFEGMKAALDIEFSTFEKKAAGDVQTSRDSITVTVGSGGKKTYEGLKEWIEDLPNKKKIGAVFKASYTHGMEPDYYLQKNNGVLPKDAAELKTLMINDLQEQITPLVADMNLSRNLNVFSRSSNFTATVSPDKKIEITVKDQWAEETLSRMINATA